MTCSVPAQQPSASKKTCAPQSEQQARLRLPSLTSGGLRAARLHLELVLSSYQHQYQCRVHQTCIKSCCSLMLQHASARLLCRAPVAAYEAQAVASCCYRASAPFSCSGMVVVEAVLLHCCCGCAAEVFPQSAGSGFLQTSRFFFSRKMESSTLTDYFSATHEPIWM